MFYLIFAEVKNVFRYFRVALNSVFGEKCKTSFFVQWLFLISATSSIIYTLAYMVLPMFNRILYRVLFRILSSKVLINALRPL